MLTRIWMLPLAALLAVCATAGALVKTITGLELAQFDGHDVLVFRTSGDIGSPSAYKRDTAAGTVSFSLPATAAQPVKDFLAQPSIQISSVVVEATSSETKFKVQLGRPELADPAYFRFSSPSRHVLVFEVFPLKQERAEAAPLTDIDQWLDGAEQAGKPKPAAGPAKPKPSPTGAKPAQASFANDAGIATLDLSSADPQRVLGLAASAGLLNLQGRAAVMTKDLGGVSLTPAGQSLMSWTENTPPGELYLAGTPQQIAEFMQYATPQFIGGQPTLKQQWGTIRPQASSKPVLGGRSAATRARIKDDPQGGLYYTDYTPGGARLSDVLVTLDASRGLNLYDVLNFLSEISGISVLIDPYAFDDPVGTKREPLKPEEFSTQQGPGFRNAGVFDASGMRPGTVRGNFENVPFDQFLNMVLETQNLVYMVQGAGGSSDSGYGDASRGPGQGTVQADPYQKPVVLVTSPARLEYELSGTNEIALNQFHYADPEQVAQILDQFGLIPDMNSGWYIYRGNGGGQGLNRGGGGNNGGGNNGGGNNGGGNGGGSVRNARVSTTVYRGDSREPVEEAVSKALAAGQNVIHVTLAPEVRPAEQVTLFATSAKR